MSDTLKMVIVLAIVGSLSGGVLAVVYKLAEPLIERQSLKRLEEAILVVLPDATDYERIKTDELIIYKGFDSQGEGVGIAVVATGSGYQGQIKIMVGFDAELQMIKGMKVLESVETPGLGGRITDKSFQDQFKGLSIRPKVEYVKGKPPTRPTQIQAITGATISSQAIVELVNKKVEELLKLNPKGGD